MKFKTPDWWHTNGVFLGTVQNPSTKKFYDVWFINNESVTWRHGDKDYEYGSCRLWRDHVPEFSGINADRDYIWGGHQALILVLWYLAFGEKPCV